MISANRRITETRSAGAGPGLAAIVLVALAAAAPVAAVVAGAVAAGVGEAQAHLFSSTGFSYLRGTLLLCLAAGTGAGVIGAGAAMFVALTDFPGRRLLAVALALPFAIPAYVAAYAYGDLFSPFGLVAGIVGASALPEIRSLLGAAFILTLTTYPYVYLAMAASLSTRSASLIEAARMLGASPYRASLRVLLAASRPAFYGGLALALMEIAADYGVADYFGVQTLSVGIFRTWYGMGDLPAAMQLAAGLFLVALLLVVMEGANRKGRASEDVRALRKSSRLTLSPPHTAAAIALCLMPVLFGFIVPLGVLVATLDTQMSARAAETLARAGANTAFVAAAGAAVATALALLLAYGSRNANGRAGKFFLRAATLGYAVPGAVMAVGVLALSAAVARTTGHAVAGGAAILLYAYVARFLTAGYNAAAGGLAQISPQMDAAAKMLGAAPTRILAALHWPMARTSLIAGAAIVAIDIAKELPTTLILRPFNFETLSTQIYRLASDERLGEAAPAALILIAFGLAPALTLSLIADGANKKSRKSETLAGLEAQTSA